MEEVIVRAAALRAVDEEVEAPLSISVSMRV